MNTKELFKNGEAWLKEQWEKRTAEYKAREQKNIEDILSTKIISTKINEAKLITDPREFRKGMVVYRVEFDRPFLLDHDYSIVSDNYPNGGFINMVYSNEWWFYKTLIHTDIFPNKIEPMERYRKSRYVQYEYFHVKHNALTSEPTWDKTAIIHCLSHPNVPLHKNLYGTPYGLHNELDPPNPLIKPFSKKEIEAFLSLVYEK